MENLELPVTISAIAEKRIGRVAETGEDFSQAGLAIMGGCGICGACIAGYNAYPSQSGYWRCEDCILDDGFATVELAIAAIWPEETIANLPELQKLAAGQLELLGLL